MKGAPRQAGVFVGYRNHLNAYGLCAESSSRWTATLLQLKGRAILLIVVYLFPGQTPSSPQNKELLAQVEGIGQSVHCAHSLCHRGRLEHGTRADERGPIHQKDQRHYSCSWSSYQQHRSWARLCDSQHVFSWVGDCAEGFGCAFQAALRFAHSASLVRLWFGSSCFPSPSGPFQQGPRKPWKDFEVDGFPENRRFFLGRHGMVDYEATDRNGTAFVEFSRHWGACSRQRRQLQNQQSAQSSHRQARPDLDGRNAKLLEHFD